MFKSRTAPGPERFEVRLTAASHFGWVLTRRPRTNDDVVAAHRGSADRFRLIGTDTRHPHCHSTERTAIFETRTDRVRRPGAPHFDLAMPMDGPLLCSGSFAPIAGLTKEGMNSSFIAVAILLVLIGLFAFSAALFCLA
jgi:putative membrane protein